MERTSNREQYDRVICQLEDEFDTALAAAVMRTPGLKLRPGGGGLVRSLPWLQWEDNDLGGYWVGFGLGFWEHQSESQWKTFLWLSYVTDDEREVTREDRPLELGYFDGVTARDAEMLAELVVAAVTVERTRRASRLSANVDLPPRL